MLRNRDVADRTPALPRMMADPHDAARLLGRALKLADRSGLMPIRNPAEIGPGVRRRVLDRLLDRLACRLAASRTPEHREVAAALTDAVEKEDYGTALSLVTMARQRSDLRAEKMISRKYRFLWICVPKVASRSIIAELRVADPDVKFIRGQTLDQVLARYPEARDYFSFAFVRHPCDRIFSCYADKHSRAWHDVNALRWFIEPYHGLRVGMSFGEFCRWLETPYGSDVFADRHWLSQHCHIRLPDGRLPDFIGHMESLETDWRAVTERLGIPHRDLPRLNTRPTELPVEGRPDAATDALLRRRYAEDFRIGGYDEIPGDSEPAELRTPLTGASGRPSPA